MALLLAALAFGLALSGWTWRADRLVYDIGLSLWQRPVPPDPVIIAIDDASIAAIGRWPWPRAVHATLLERLAAARPRAIGLDLIFSEADSDPRQDSLLSRALARAAPVVLSVAWQRSSTGEPPQMLRPVTDTAPGVTLGHAEATVDADGVMRHAFLEAGWGNERVPHLALALLRAGGEAAAQGLPILDAVQDEGLLAGPDTSVGTSLGTAAGTARNSSAAQWRRHGRFLLRYAGPPGHLQRLSYVDVLSGKVPAEALTGRYLMVGMTATGMGDSAATPVNRQQHAMPGVELLGHALYTLRSGDTLRPVPPLASAGLSALMLLALMAGIQWLGPRRALVLALLSVPLVLGASLLALGAGLWWSPVPWMITAALAYPLWSWRQLEQAVDALDAEIRLLQPEGGLGPAAGRPVEAAALPTLSPPTNPAGAAPGNRVQGDADNARRNPLSSRLETLHAATETVRSARRFLADALAGLPTAMAVTDERGRVLLANLHMARLFEADDAQQMQGLDLPALLVEFVPNPALDWPTLFAADPCAAVPRVVEARLARQGDFLLHFAPVQLLEQQRWVVTWADISAIRQAQRRRDRALAFVSHDLRGPAQAIVLLASLHREGRLQMPRDELLAEVQRQASRTLQLAEDFVRVADVESRPLQLQQIDPGVLLDEVAADFHPQALDAGLTLQVRPPRHTGPMHWPLDADLLRRALGNLVSNALRHGPSGSSVTLAAEPMPETDMLCLSVTDQGPGLTAAQRQRLNQGDEGLPAGDTRGVGLGLQFVQRVASRHGGQLQVIPGPGGIGCRFELRLGRGTQAGGVGAGWIGPPTEPEGQEVS